MRQTKLFYNARFQRIAVNVIRIAALVLVGTFISQLNSHDVQAVAPACSSGAAAQNGISVAPSHGQSFYIDTGTSPKLDAGYVGYRVTNTTGSTQNDLWTETSDFTGGILGLSNSLDHYQQVQSLTNNSTKASYFLLKANAATTTPQTHHLKVWDGRPDLPSSTMLYDCVYTFTSVKETIKAAANKVSDTGYGAAAAIEVSNTTPEIGQTITISVEGTSGTIGAGASPDGSIVWLTPAAISSWPTRSLRLESVSVTFERGTAWSGGNSSPVTYTDQLMISNAQTCLKKSANPSTCAGGTGNASPEYRAFYTFRVVGVPSTSVKAVPVAQIASGTQIKHADTTGVGSTLDISFSSVAINASLTKSVTGTTGLQTVTCGGSCVVPGGVSGETYAAVPYRLTASSSTATTVAVDEIVDRPQNGVIYKPGTATITDIGRTNAAIDDPSYIASESAQNPRPLHFVGPFNLNSSVTASLNYQMWVPVGSFTNTAYAKIGDLLIGATASSMSKVIVTSDGSGTVGVVTTTEELGVVAATVAASGITSSAATMNGTVDPNGANPLTATFQYSTNSSLSGATTVTATTPASGSLNGLTTPTNVSYGLTGLSSYTTYFYRVVAGSAQGEILSFTTDAVVAPPTAATTSATSITSSSATLNGTLNPNLTSIPTIQFIYGTSATLASGNTTITLDDGAGGNLTASGASSQPFSKAVTGLSNGTTYHYKIRACTVTNCSTFVDGSIVSFVAQNPPANPVLGVTKTEDDADNSVIPGQTITYTVTIANTGGVSGSTSFTDTIPTGMGAPGNLSYTNCGTPSSGYSAPIMTVSSITVGTTDSCIVTYTLAINTPLNEGITLTNSVDVAAASEGGNNPSAVSSSTLTVDTTPNLSTSTKSVSDNNGGTVEPGDTLTYTIIAINTGDGRATGVTITDTISSNTENLTNVNRTNCGTSTNGSTSSQLNITGATVVIGTNCVITFDVTVKTPLNEGTSIPNISTISAASEGGVGANPSSNVLTVNATPSLSVTHTEDDADNTVSPNQSVGYTITIQNTGNGQASGVSVSGSADSNATLNTGSFNFSNCGSPSNVSTASSLSLSNVTIAAGATCTITYSSNVKGSATNGSTIASSADVGPSAEGGNNPALVSATTLTVAITSAPSGLHFLNGITDLSCNGVSSNRSLRTSWSNTSGAASYDVSLDNGAAISAGTNTYYDWLLPAADGTHTFAVRSIDSFSNISQWSSDCSVTLDQTPPTVNAGSDQTKQTNFTQSDSSASDGTSGIASYAWTKVSGPGGITFTNASDLHPDISADTDGTYVLRLTVTDNAGNSASDTFILIWDTTGASVDAGTDKDANSSFIQTSSSATDSGSGIAGYAWTKVSGPGTVTFTNASDLHPSISASADGTYVLRLTITDNVGNSTSDTFTLIWDTSAPTVDAGSDKTTNISFSQTSANATDSGSGIASYSWSKQSGPGNVTFINSSALQPSISADTDGTYVLRILVTDNAGNTASDTFTLIWDTTPSTVDAGTDVNTSTSFTQNSSSATDGTSGIASYTWSKISGPGTITFGTSSILHPSISASADGTYVLRLTTTDNAGNSANDSFTLVWTTPTSPTNDNDGATETEEQLAPNSGDANDDGQSDADQKNVTSFVNSLTNTYSVLENSNNCQNTDVSQRKMSELSTSDGSYVYPAGLMNFTLVCGTPGMTTRVNQYYFGITTTNLVARKYDSLTNTFSTIADAEISYVTVGGQQAVKISYDITDGGSLDEDGLVNGSIVDPAGPAVLSSSVGTPNTGMANQSQLLTVLYGTIGLGLLSAAFYLGTRHNFKKLS